MGESYVFFCLFCFSFEIVEKMFSWLAGKIRSLAIEGERVGGGGNSKLLLGQG